MTPAERWMAAVLGAGFTALVLADLVEGYTVAKLSVGFILLFWFPLLVVHELGHALTARFFGWRVIEFSIGYGTQIARFRIGETLVVIRAVPAGGHIIPAPVRRRVARLQSALIYLGGPGIELAAVGAVALALGAEALLSHPHDVATVAAQSLALTALIGAGINLVPFTAADSASDGMGILASAWLAPDQMEVMAALPYRRAAESRLDQGDAAGALAVIERGLAALPGSLPLQIARAVCLAVDGDQPKAQAQLQEIRDLPELDESIEAEALHAAALMVLECGDRSLLSEAESACRAALRLSPRVRFEITLGRIELEWERFARARGTLMRAFKRTRDPRLEDQCIAYLALAAYGDKQMEEGELFFATLRSRKASRRLLQRVQQARAAMAGTQEADR